MKTDDDGGTSSDIEDRRGQGSRGGGLGALPIGKGGAALSLPVLIIVVIVSIIGGKSLGGGGGGGFDIGNVFNQLQPAPSAVPGSNRVPGAADPQADAVKFVSFVLDDTQKFWAAQMGADYRKAKLVLYTDGVNTGGCGSATSAAGPFYCPGDEKVYLDLSFFDELATKFGASGDFAQAYVIAHELGHHIQKVTGVNDKVRQQQEANPTKANELSVRLELQADCFAGVWGYSTYDRGILESGDLEEGLNAATRVGDDYIQKNLGNGQIRPDLFTHGTSAQRMKWFKTGFDSGDAAKCDTFSVSNP